MSSLYVSSHLHWDYSNSLNSQSSVQLKGFQLEQQSHMFCSLPVSFRSFIASVTSAYIFFNTSFHKPLKCCYNYLPNFIVKTLSLNDAIWIELFHFSTCKTLNSAIWSYTRTPFIFLVTFLQMFNPRYIIHNFRTQKLM